MAEPLPPTPLDAADPRPPSPDVVKATERKAELMSDKAWGKRYIDGDQDARDEMAKLNAAIIGPAPVVPAHPEIIAHLRDAGVGEDVVEQFIAGKPIPKAERDMADRWVHARIRDAAWRQRYLEGDYEAHRMMRVATMMRTLPVEGA